MACPGCRRPRDRAPAEAGAVDDLAGAAPQRLDTYLPARIQGRSLSGMPNGVPAGRRRPSWSPTTDCASTSRTSCPGSFAVRRPGVVGPAGTPWKGRNKPHRGDRAWVTAWSPNRSPAGCRWISPMMRPCGSATRPSIRRSTSKVAARSNVIWSPACAGRALRVPRRGPGKGVGPCHPGDVDQPTPTGGRRSRRARHWEGDFSSACTAARSAPWWSAAPVHDAGPSPA